MENAPRYATEGDGLYWELSYAVTRLFTEAPEETAPIPAIAQLLGRRLGWDVVNFWTLDEARVLLVCREVWHEPGRESPNFEKVTRARQFSFGEGLPGSAWKERGVIWKPDVTSDENFPRASVAQLDGLHTGVAFPIYAGRRVLGAMECFSRDVRQPDPGLLNFFQALGGQIGVFLERAVDKAAIPGEQQFHLLAQGASDAVFTIDEESNVLFANSAAHLIFGYEQGDLIGCKLTVVMPEYLRRVHEAGIRHYIETGERHISWQGVPLPGLHKDGHEISLEISFGEFYRGGRRVFTGFCRLLSAQPEA